MSGTCSKTEISPTSTLPSFSNSNRKNRYFGLGEAIAAKKELYRKHLFLITYHLFSNQKLTTYRIKQLIEVLTRTRYLKVNVNDKNDETSLKP